MMVWPHVELDQLADIRGGATPRRDNASYWNGDIPWVTPTDLPKPGEGIVDVENTADAITSDALASCSASLMPPGTVLFSSRASIGKIGIASVPLSTNQGFANLIPRPGLESRYLAWCLHFHTGRIASLAGSTTFKEVSKSVLKRYRIPFPPLSEQRRIVEILDEVDRLRSLRLEANIKAKRILSALFVRTFGDPATNPMGWRIAPFGDAIVDTQYGTSKRAHASGKGVPILRMNNITSEGELVLGDLKFVELAPFELERQLLQPGDILFNRTNSIDLVGKTGLWTRSDIAAVAASYLIRVRVDQKKVVPSYIWALMNTTYTKTSLAMKARRAVGMANINATELRRLPMMFPPIQRQRDFVGYLALIRPTNDHREVCKMSIEHLCKNLIARAFSGSLTMPRRKARRWVLNEEKGHQAEFP